MGEKKISGGITALAVTTAAMGAAGFYLTQKYVRRKTPNFAKMHRTEETWLYNSMKELVLVRSREGLVLRGAMLRPRRPRHYWAICVHGYREAREAVANYGRHYLEQGFSVLLPDLRGHGKSDGNYTTMGARDSEDLILWVNYILNMDHDAEIVIHGVSMGATAALIASGSKDLPRQVRCVISDSAYSSYIEMCGQVCRRHHIPFLLLKPAFSLCTRVLAGFWPGEADPMPAVKRSVTPTFFIHGEKDQLVKPAMMTRLYQACAAPKDWFLLEDCLHGGAAHLDPILYWNKVEDFLCQHWEDKEKRTGGSTICP